MRRLIAFLTNLDARAWRTIVVSFVLFGGVGIVFLFGASLLGISGEGTVESWMSAAHGPWSLPVAVAAFAILALGGVPQFMLIAGAVVAFGPWNGLAYSWIGTLVSSVIGFYCGRAFGARLLHDYAGEGVQKFKKLIGRNGLMASLIVRLVPSAPFVVVNMAAGVTPMRFRDFLLGTAIGIVPKIALTAFAGNSAIRAIRGGGAQHIVLLVIAALVWLAAGWFARIWLKRREAAAEAEDIGGEAR